MVFLLERVVDRQYHNVTMLQVAVWRAHAGQASVAVVCKNIIIKSPMYNSRIVGSTVWLATTCALYVLPDIMSIINRLLSAALGYIVKGSQDHNSAANA